MVKKMTKDDFGYNKSLKDLWFSSNPQLPNGSFSLRLKKGYDKYYWYFQYSNTQKKNRVKYLCSTFKGENDEGFNSFQICLKVLNEKFENNFRPKLYDGTPLSVLIDEYIGEIIKEELSDEGRKYETTQSMKNGVNKFKEYCLKEKLTLRDVKDEKVFKEHIKTYLELMKDRGLSRNTIRTYIKHIRGFIEWLSDEDGKDLVKTNPITSKFISKIYPTNRMEKKGVGMRNTMYKQSYYDEMFQCCSHKVNELWNEFCKNGWNRENTNQPMGVGSDIVYFVSLFQIYGGFRLGEILCSYRNVEYWNNRRDKKNSSSYWEKREGIVKGKKKDVWFLYIDDYKGVTSSIPFELSIRSWVKPPHWVGKPTKLNRKGEPFYWDTPLVEICMEMFRVSPFIFSSPNLRSHSDRHYGKTYYGNLFKQRMVNKGVGGEGWERFGVQSSHSLRDYFITKGINDGMSVEELSQLSRHLPSTLWKYYLMYSEEGQLKRKRKYDKDIKIKKKIDLKVRDKG
tara:strand:- start:61 stop:1587 length:1527 start_codon:yes stop_codon:yes gene_type:complete